METDLTPEERLAAAKHELQNKMLPLIKEFEAETGLKVHEIGIERPMLIDRGWGNIICLKVRLHSL